MNIRDYCRLKAAAHAEGAPRTTHLARYEAAAARPKTKTPFDIRCPYCGAPPTVWCLEN